MSTPSNPSHNGGDVDRRIDRLVERHEALTQSLELLVQMHHDHDERIKKLEAIQAQNAETMALLGRVQEQLTPILVDHEVRLKRIEGRQ